MLVDSTLLGTFRSRFEAKDPDPKNFIRRATKLDFYLTVHDIVEERRTKGFAWGGIAADFTELGVTMSVSTLKTCFRRARERTQGLHPRSKRPARRPSTPRRGRSDASETPLDSTAAAPEPSRAADERLEPVASDLPQSSAETTSPQNPELRRDEPAREKEPVTPPDPPAELAPGELAPSPVDTGPQKRVGSRKEGSLEGRTSSAELPREEAIHEKRAAIAAAGDVSAGVHGASVNVVPSGDAAVAKVEEGDGAPSADAGARAESVSDGPSAVADPRGPESPHQNVSRLEAMRARASASEKRRLAFVPRADDEL